MKKVKKSPVHLQYWCKTSLIDAEVCKRKNIEFNMELAKDLEKEARHYFIVDKSGNFKVVPGREFEKYFDDKEASEMKQTKAAVTAIDNFIKQVHNI